MAEALSSAFALCSVRLHLMRRPVKGAHFRGLAHNPDPALVPRALAFGSALGSGPHAPFTPACAPQSARPRPIPDANALSSTSALFSGPRAPFTPACARQSRAPPGPRRSSWDPRLARVLMQPFTPACAQRSRAPQTHPGCQRSLVRIRALFGSACAIHSRLRSTVPRPLGQALALGSALGSGPHAPFTPACAHSPARPLGQALALGSALGSGPHGPFNPACAPQSRPARPRPIPDANVLSSASALFSGPRAPFTPACARQSRAPWARRSRWNPRLARVRMRRSLPLALHSPAPRPVPDTKGALVRFRVSSGPLPDSAPPLLHRPQALSSASHSVPVHMRAARAPQPAPDLSHARPHPHSVAVHGRAQSRPRSLARPRPQARSSAFRALRLVESPHAPVDGHSLPHAFQGPRRDQTRAATLRRALRGDARARAGRGARERVHDQAAPHEARAELDLLEAAERPSRGYSPSD
jgi:hypothetical protein